jgi:hypothetical protein
MQTWLRGSRGNLAVVIRNAMKVSERSVYKCCNALSKISAKLRDFIAESSLTTLAPSALPSYCTSPDICIPIPGTSSRLPLTWAHIRAIQRLEKFFARLYDQTQEEKYGSWMITLFQINASIHDGNAQDEIEFANSRTRASR